MSFLDGIAEIFKGKKTEQPQVPQQNIDQRITDLQAHADNLNSIIEKGGRDFRNPADVQALESTRQQLAQLQEQKAQVNISQPVTNAEPSEVPQQIPVQKPQEEAQVA